jgi:hypothetical protein
MAQVLDNNMPIIMNTSTVPGIVDIKALKIKTVFILTLFKAPKLCVAVLVKSRL